MTYRQLWEIWSQCVLQEIQYKKRRSNKYKRTYHYMYNFVIFLYIMYNKKTGK